MIPKEIEEYIRQISSQEPVELYELYRETWLKAIYPRMISGSVQGRFLEMISCMIKPKQILEIGTFTGYSAICLSKGLQEGGCLHTIEQNEEIIYIAEKYFDKLKLNDKIKQHTGNALEIIPEIDEEFDLVFIDADKEDYTAYYEAVLPKMKPGSFILADNVLWDGKVLEPETADKETKGIIAFNEYVKNDPRTEQVILSVRDGVMVIRVNSE